MQSEKEKCRLGLLYDANNDPELIAERLAIKQKCHEYNHMSPLLTDERTATLREILGTTGNPCRILHPLPTTTE